MFGGLELKGPNEAKKEPVSGFSFMSSTSTPAEEETAETTKVEENEESPPASGFSFLSQTVTKKKSVDAQDENADVGDLSNEKIKEVLVEPVVKSSGFSFLTPPTDTISTQNGESVVSNSAHKGGSIFDMLKVAEAKPELPTPDVAHTVESNVESSHEDLLSLSNPTQAVGSGVVFGGAAKPKAVKKKTRAKKIGSGASATGLPPVVPVSSNNVTPLPPAYDQHGEQEEHGSQNDFSNLSEAANQAANRAEEFISQKRQEDMTKSSSMYSGRYSNDSSIIEDYGDSSSSFAPPHLQDSEDSDEYRKAAAAAEDAKLHSGTSKKSSMFGHMTIGGFFKTKKGGSNGSIENRSSHGNWSSHGKEELRIPNYGKSSSSRSMNEDENHDNDERQRMELEREKEAERVRAEEARKIFEQKRYEEEQQKLKEAEELAERARLEAEEERKRKEAELAKRTPQQKLQALLEAFELKSQKATMVVSELRQERSALVEKMALAEKQSRLVTQQISQAEKQQMEAAEKEDFELADRLAAVISKYEEEKDEKSQVLVSIESLIEDIDSKTIGAVKSVWHCFIQIQDDLKAFSREEESSDINDSEDLFKRFELNTKRLNAENERLSADLKTIERDEELTRIERVELEALISEQTCDIEEKLHVSRDQLDVINAEIDELRKQLEAKEMEAAKVKMDLHNHEEAIEGIRSNFSRQLTRLGKKEDAVMESRKDWEREEAEYKKASEVHEAEVTAHSEALVAHDKILLQVKEEIEIAESLARIIAQEFVISKKSSDESVDEDVLLAQSDVLELEAAVEEARHILSSAQFTIDSLKEEIQTINVRLPILEADKTMAASKRDFKAAAKASKEIKELQSKLDQCNENLKGDASEKLGSAEKDLEALEISLVEKKAFAHEKEKHGGKKRMVQIAKKVINLERLREEVCGTDADTELSVKSIGGLILDTQISALMVEGDELDRKYGGWSDIMLEYASKYHHDSGDDGEPDNHTDIIDNVESTVKYDDATETLPANEPIKKDAEEGQEECIDDKEQRLEKYKALLRRMEELEEALGAAIETEEYDDAAELDDKIQSLKSEMDKLNITDADLETEAHVVDDNPQHSVDESESDLAVTTDVDESELNDTIVPDDQIEAKTGEIVTDEDESQLIDDVDEPKGSTEEHLEEPLEEDNLSDVNLDENLDS